MEWISYDELRKQSQEEAKEWREDIQESKYGLAKIVALEALPFFMGAGLAQTGRVTEQEAIPAIPILIDAMWNMEGYFTPRGLWNLTKYAAGVGIVYADKIAAYHT